MDLHMFSENHFVLSTICDASFNREHNKVMILGVVWFTGSYLGLSFVVVT